MLINDGVSHRLYGRRSVVAVSRTKRADFSYPYSRRNGVSPLRHLDRLGCDSQVAYDALPAGCPPRIRLDHLGSFCRCPVARPGPGRAGFLSRDGSQAPRFRCLSRIALVGAFFVIREWPT